MGVELVEMSQERAALSAQWVPGWQDELPSTIPKRRQIFIITNTPTQISFSWIADKFVFFRGSYSVKLLKEQKCVLQFVMRTIMKSNALFFDTTSLYNI